MLDGHVGSEQVLIREALGPVTGPDRAALPGG
jgi:hypothetical protein